jgi:hypothetical protein
VWANTWHVGRSRPRRCGGLFWKVTESIVSIGFFHQADSSASDSLCLPDPGTRQTANRSFWRNRSSNLGVDRTVTARSHPVVTTSHNVIYLKNYQAIFHNKPTALERLTLAHVSLTLYLHR